MRSLAWRLAYGEKRCLSYFVSSRPENLGARSYFRPAAPGMGLLWKRSRAFCPDAFPCSCYQARARRVGWLRLCSSALKPASVGSLVLAVQSSMDPVGFEKCPPETEGPALGHGVGSELCLWSPALCSFPLISPMPLECVALCANLSLHCTSDWGHLVTPWGRFLGPLTSP